MGRFIEEARKELCSDLRVVTELMSWKGESSHAPMNILHRASHIEVEGGFAGSTRPFPAQVLQRLVPTGTVASATTFLPSQFGQVNGCQPSGPDSYSNLPVPWHSLQPGVPAQWHFSCFGMRCSSLS